MSEAERKRRYDYKKNRSKWIRIQAFVIAMVTLAVALLAIVYNNTNKNYYINYTENGNVDYKVYLKENDFYKDAYLGKDQIYVAALIDRVVADLKYELVMEEAVEYSYSYKVDAVLKIADKTSGKTVYSSKYPIKELTKVDPEGKSQGIKINQRAEISYDTYNDIANKFIDTYGLQDIESTVVLVMDVEVISACESFADENSRNNYSVSLSVPLTKQKVDVKMVSSVPSAETKILACTENAAKAILKVALISSSVIDALLVALLVVFIFITINTDIDYEMKVNRILSSYKSYIQKIVSPFDSTGYQVLVMDTFREMLEIRDTIQSPILMNENEDKTRTLFFIPTNTKLLYVFEIKVDDYDEIYNIEEPEEMIEEEPAPAVEEKVSEIEEETVIIMENVDAEALAEAIAAPSVSLSQIDYDMDDDEEDDEGVEVIGVVWPERPTHNKVYRYDPNGERVTKGDIVLVPSRDKEKNRDIIRKATVAHGNHKIDPEHLTHPLKKIIGIVKRKAEEALMPKEPKEK